jgi:hypothetical protein
MAHTQGGTNDGASINVPKLVTGLAFFSKLASALFFFNEDFGCAALWQRTLPSYRSHPTRVLDLSLASIHVLFHLRRQAIKGNRENNSPSMSMSMSIDCGHWNRMGAYSMKR